MEICREGAIALEDEMSRPSIDMRRCLACGQCISVCPTGVLTAGVTGCRIQLGGKLGRHPRLACELPGIYDAETTLAIVKACLDLYKKNSARGGRFGKVLQESDIERLAGQFKKKVRP